MRLDTDRLVADQLAGRLPGRARDYRAARRAGRRSRTEPGCRGAGRDARRQNWLRPSRCPMRSSWRAAWRGTPPCRYRPAAPDGPVSIQITSDLDQLASTLAAAPDQGGRHAGAAAHGSASAGARPAAGERQDRARRQLGPAVSCRDVSREVRAGASSVAPCAVARSWPACRQIPALKSAALSQSSLRGLVSRAQHRGPMRAKHRPSLIREIDIEAGTFAILGRVFRDVQTRCPARVRRMADRRAWPVRCRGRHGARQPVRRRADPARYATPVAAGG